MRRQRTRTTAWPAVADLMTVFAVIGLSSAVIVRHQSAGEANQLRLDLEEAESTLEAQEAEILALRERLTDSDEVGFVPCWRGLGPGEPKYYLTYNVTVVQSGRYRVEPHGHWRDGSELRGQLDFRLLDVLMDHPTEAIDAANLRDFGERLERAVASTADYERGCALAVTLDRTATGGDIQVLTGAGFYPVIRG